MSKSISQPVPLLATEDETWEAAEFIMKSISNGSVRDSLHIIRHNGYYLKKIIRSIKINERFQSNDAHSPCPCTIVPEILLRGKWLQRTGFQPGNMVWVLPFADLLIVIPQEGLKK
ncbi:hypothetical protein A4H97_01540 [Niastella yeongjuensis]|uniref:Toxin SymE-like domain-containing protein n=1 Tax=Niastella yeongjuensis TaxID=354355 RepID=A0A1V9EWQ5_9BACT|nr:hypothetical protein [Niastella yeongjuensis]OQP50550.1 hypothetical protein A4H97_01540 [Niastella yeongjuensis]SEN29178.1 Toxin SymE, type I toxin-antitoxin system [Niastella yeongjuensis]